MFTQTATFNPTAGDVAGAIALMPWGLEALVKQAIAAYPGRAMEVWAAAQLVLEGFATPDPAGTAVSVAGDGPSRIVMIVGQVWSCPCSDHNAGPCTHELAAWLATDEAPAGLVTRPGTEKGSAASVAARTPNQE